MLANCVRGGDKAREVFANQELHSLVLNSDTIIVLWINVSYKTAHAFGKHGYLNWWVMEKYVRKVYCNAFIYKSEKTYIAFD